MKRFFYLLLLALPLLTSCIRLFEERTPEYIMSKVWGIDIWNYEYNVCSFKDEWCPNGDGTTEIKLEIELTEDDIELLVSKGAKPLPLLDDVDNKSSLEDSSGIYDASDGIYIYEQYTQEPECKFLMYDRESKVLYYYLFIM